MKHVIDYLSKGDRGYELLVQEHREAVRAKPLKLKKWHSIEEAFQAIVKNCLAQVHGNERGVVSGHDPSSVHQMRVGLRRLRSALDLFAAIIPAPAEFDTDLRWIAAELGAARDWEVLAGATLGKAFEFEQDGRDAIGTRQAAKTRAISSREVAATAVNSVRYTRLVLKLTVWNDTMGWRNGSIDKKRDALTKPILRYAHATLAKRHKKLLKRGHRLADLEDARRHRARIAAKKLRYATEFFSSLFPRRAVKKYISALSELQDDLGWRNDVVVADKLLESLSASNPEIAGGTGFARGYLRSHAAQDHDSMKTLWNTFRRLSPLRHES